MSALQQLMQGYSRDISAIDAHNKEHDEEVASRKASDANEEFGNYLDHISSGAVDLGSAATAWHLGRKIYLKYQERKAKKAQENDGQDQSGQDGDTPNTSESQAQAQRSAEGGDATEENLSKAQGASSDPISTEDSFFPDNPSAPVGEDPFDGPVSQSAKVAGEQATGKAPPDPIESEGSFFPDAPATAVEDDPFGGPVSQRVAQGANIKQSASTGGDVDAQPQAQPAQQPTQAQAQESSQGGQAGDTTTEVGGQDVQGRTTTGDFGGPGGSATEEFGSADQGIVRVRPTQLTQRAPTQGDADAPGGGNAGGQVGRNVDTATSEITDESGNSIGDVIKQGLGKARGAIGDTIDGVGNMAKNVAGRVGGAVKSLLPDSVSSAMDTGLITTDAVLDGIPVVGEVASLITGLVALFEGIGHKPKTADDEAGETTKLAPGTAVAGVDPKSLVPQQAVNVVA